MKATAEDMILLCEQHESPELPVRPILFRPISSCHVFCPFLYCRFLSCSLLSFFCTPLLLYVLISLPLNICDLMCYCVLITSWSVLLSGWVLIISLLSSYENTSITHCIVNIFLLPPLSSFFLSFFPFFCLSVSSCFYSSPLSSYFTLLSHYSYLFSSPLVFTLPHNSLLPYPFTDVSRG